MSPTSHSLIHWKAASPSLLPDFIIGGAMKSGTSTLHAILDKHPDVHIPKGELHFFDIDNLFHHKDFHFFDRDTNKWRYKNFEEHHEKIWDWYLSHYQGKENKLTGEDSTTYLTSPLAAQRIAQQDKKVKLLFLLRHPTDRAYSQYYHMLRSGRAPYNFEDMVMYQPEHILQRSLYTEQLLPYYHNFPKDQIKIILFEDLVARTKTTIEKICDFLSLDHAKFSDEVFQTHSNKAKLPSSIRMQIWFNRVMSNKGQTFRHDAAPNASVRARKPIFRLIKKAHRLINPLTRTKKPPINESTRNFLDDFFVKKLDGLDELTRKTFMERWFDHS